MNQLYIWIIIILVALYIATLVKSIAKGKVNVNKPLPYNTRNSILTNAELNFYKSLSLHINNNVIILLKVSLKDIFTIDKNVGKDYIKYFNKISQKHIDFLICDSTTIRPLFAIELDDSSHNIAKTVKRDEFVNKVYNTAMLRLIRVKVKSSYTRHDFDNIPIEYLCNDIITETPIFEPK